MVIHRVYTVKISEAVRINPLMLACALCIPQGFCRAKARTAGHINCPLAAMDKIPKRCEVKLNISFFLDDHEEFQPTTKQVQNQNLVCIGKWCRQFTKLVSGKSLDLRRDKGFSLNSCPAGAYLDHLCNLRTEATIRAVQASLYEEESQRKKRRKVTKQDETLVPLVDVELPAVEHASISLPAKTVKMAFGLRGAELWVQGDPDTLIHIVAGCRTFDDSQHGRVRSKSKVTDNE